MAEVGEEGIRYHATLIRTVGDNGALVPATGIVSSLSPIAAYERAPKAIKGARRRNS